MWHLGRKKYKKLPHEAHNTNNISWGQGYILYDLTNNMQIQIWDAGCSFATLLSSNFLFLKHLLSPLITFLNPPTPTPSSPMLPPATHCQHPITPFPLLSPFHPPQPMTRSSAWGREWPSERTKVVMFSSTPKDRLSRTQPNPYEGWEGQMCMQDGMLGSSSIRNPTPAILSHNFIGHFI